MPLNLEHPGDYQFVRSVTTEGIIVGEQLLEKSFILTPEEVRPDWPVQHIDMLTADHLVEILSLQPELLVLGTGPQQRFPKPQLLMPCLQQGVGVEIMSTDAACRTFNICVHENRRVIAALML